MEGYNPYERSNYGGSYVSSQHNTKNNVSSFTQRVMSAKLLRMKQVQNQLYETQAKLNVGILGIFYICFIDVSVVFDQLIIIMYFNMSGSGTRKQNPQDSSTETRLCS